MDLLKGFLEAKKIQKFTELPIGGKVLCSGATVSTGGGLQGCNTQYKGAQETLISRQSGFSTSTFCIRLPPIPERLGRIVADYGNQKYNEQGKSDRR